MNKVPRWVFRYVGNKTFDFSSKKKDFLPKTTKFGPKLAFLSIAGSFGAGMVGGCGARAVSRETPIYFIQLASDLELRVSLSWMDATMPPLSRDNISRVSFYSEI